MDNIRHYGKIENGRMRFTTYNRIKFESALQQLEGRDFELMIREAQEPVTQDQHGYYRAGILKTLATTELFGGWEEDRIHKFFKSKFLRVTYIEEVNGKQVVVHDSESTANIGKKRMQQYIDDVLRWCAEEGITIGTPQDYFYGKNRTRTRK